MDYQRLSIHTYAITLSITNSKDRFMEYFDQLLSSLSAQFGNTIPRLLGAIAILIIGLMIAKAIRNFVRKMLTQSGIDQKMDPQGKTPFSLAATISKLIYWVLLIYLFLFVLNMVGVGGDALGPLKGLLSEIGGYIPNIIGAGLIGFIGYMIANIGKEAVGLISSGIDSVGDRMGISGDFNLTGILKQIVFLFIFIPIILVALDTLNISTISDPAKHMLQTFFDAIPNIIGAAIILFVFIFGGRFISNVVKELMDNLGVDNSMKGLNISGMIGENQSISSISSKILYFFIAFFGVITAVEKLNFGRLSEILNDVLDLSGHILFGMIILLLGNQISRFVADYFNKTNQPAISTIARFATLGLFLAISLRYMGIADDIVNLAFGLILGAVAVAFALSFGLGGREAAGEQMKRFFARFNN